MYLKCKRFLLHYTSSWKSFEARMSRDAGDDTQSDGSTCGIGFRPDNNSARTSSTQDGVIFRPAALPVEERRHSMRRLEAERRGANAQRQDRVDRDVGGPSDRFHNQMVRSGAARTTYTWRTSSESEGRAPVGAWSRTPPTWGSRSDGSPTSTIQRSTGQPRSANSTGPEHRSSSWPSSHTTPTSFSRWLCPVLTTAAARGPGLCMSGPTPSIGWTTDT